MVVYFRNIKEFILIDLLMKIVFSIQKEYPVSFLDLIREALIAKGLAFPDPSTRIGRLNQETFALHI